MWVNEDLVPTPKAMRIWDWFSFASLWWGQNFSAGGWSTGASLINVGLTLNQTMAICVAGSFLTSLCGVAMARPGARYHIGFPTLARTSFGIRGSKIMVGIRGIVAVIWYAVQSFYGASLLNVGFRAVFGHGWVHLHNGLPASAHTTTQFMVVYFIFWLVQLPFVFVHPSTARHIFTIKSFILPVSAFAFLGGVVHLAGGTLDFKLIQKSQAHGTKLSWALLQGLNAIFGTISPMLINQPDIGRYANRPSSALHPQFWSMWINKIIVFFIGVVTAAASAKMFGTTVWNVWDLCTKILDHHWNAHWRAGIALFALAQCAGTIATNVFANSIPFGVDMAGCFPKYINIVRGQFICCVLSWAVCPWLILTSGAKFVTFLGSYTFFMASVVGIMIADYYVVRRGNIHVPSLYDFTPGSVYMPKPNGFQLKGLLTWLVTIIIGIPGLAASYGTTLAAAHIYNTGFLLCFCAAFIVYSVVMLILPEKIFPDERKDESSFTWEWLGRTGDGYYPGEPEITFGRGVLHQATGDNFLHRHSHAADSESDITEKDKEGVIHPHSHTVVGVPIAPAQGP
ncbi:hypothetical protein TREMEDRAFT_33665 [Tremella mesenterica DSM 1558]|uniref:uncharacterized protein n=1 Tax=Tremella mesenterica (strain ATCC 24925 / CBS 8224 / DSM 1558 / NBRC 9311 / NRRL Y-6157 / RJB 2259-6 / UBC 559-6) TaxID=578456 RepID=UPI0003F4926E|nr:uncharacterized protein TREMEDRAFT_33665 [Tremella mesenterica DSM 1558]EIW67353.1 hypothetical protein TREMEDRAFT_33665 [Tremella mesenterica DSM 1558]